MCESYHVRRTLCTCNLTSIVHQEIEARLTYAATTCAQNSSLNIAQLLQ